MGKHVLTDRPSSGVASLWPSFRPRSDLVWVQCSCCPVAPYSYCCLHRFLSGCSSCKFGRRIAQFAWSASPTSLSDVWLAARCFHSAWHLDCYRLSCCEWLWPTLKLWSLKDKRPSPQIFDESRCATREFDLLCLQWIHLLVEYQVTMTFFTNRRLPFIGNCSSICIWSIMLFDIQD